jgi:hypothetical protein
MDTERALEAFASRIEDEGSIIPPGLPQQVSIRPAGALAVAVKRVEGQVIAKIRQYAAAAGDSWFYSWDVNDKHSKRKDGKTTIEGPSVKMTNDLARLYGNCAAEITRVEETPSHWTLFARFVDFETGYEYVRPFQQRKSQGQGQGTQAERQRDIAFQIGASKALRNCIVNSLGIFSDIALEAAKASLVQHVGEKLEHYRAKAVERLETYGIPLARVERAHGIAAKDWDAKLIARVIAQIQALNDGMTTPEELYPDPDQPEQATTAATAGPASLQSFAAATPGPEKETSAPTGGAAPKTDKPKATKPKPAPVPKDETPPPTTGQSISTGEERVDPAQGPVDGDGKPIEHDADGVEKEDDQLEVPAFLRRTGDKKPEPPHLTEEEAKAKHPTMSKFWIEGYLARDKGLSGVAPVKLEPMQVRHWRAGYDARDMELDDAAEGS